MTALAASFSAPVVSGPRASARPTASSKRAAAQAAFARAGGSPARGGVSVSAFSASGSVRIGRADMTAALRPNIPTHLKRGSRGGAVMVRAAVGPCG
jgi:hypothetical protein